MTNHPSFTGNLISDQEHTACVDRFGDLFTEFIEPILDGFDVYARGRFHPDDAPCLYIFRNNEIYENEKRGVFLHIQETHEDNAIEVVFRKIYDRSTKESIDILPEENWSNLSDCYLARTNENWKSFVVRNQQEIEEARRLIQIAISTYDGICS